MSDAKKGFMLWLHAITPIHSGTGQAAAVIDLPIAREKATGWPVIPGSSIKGVLREQFRITLATQGKTDSEITEFLKHTFGEHDNAGELGFGDQRIVFLAVRSFFGTFAYLTCPTVLRRVSRDAGALTDGALLKEIDEVSGLDALAGKALVRDQKIYLEDIDLHHRGEPQHAGALAEQLFSGDAERQAFRDRLAVVSDDVFNYFSETGTEVAARIRLKEFSKTVEDGGLWYEEAVPAESVFAGPVVRVRGDGARLVDVRAGLRDQTVQFGGDASVGRGLCRWATGEGR